MRGRRGAEAKKASWGAGWTLKFQRNIPQAEVKGIRGGMKAMGLALLQPGAWSAVHDYVGTFVDFGGEGYCSGHLVHLVPWPCNTCGLTQGPEMKRRKNIGRGTISQQLMSKVRISPTSQELPALRRLHPMGWLQMQLLSTPYFPTIPI